MARSQKDTARMRSSKTPRLIGDAEQLVNDWDLYFVLFDREDLAWL